MKLAIRIALGLWIASTTLSAAPSPQLPLIPRPAHVDAGQGVYRATGVAARELRAVCGDSDAALQVWLKERSAAVPLSIQVGASALGPEGYRLHVAATHIVIDSADAAGAFYGVQTLCQLVPPAVPAASAPYGGGGEAVTIPAVDIADAPRFRWRGMHLDVSRHFFTVAEVERYIDLLAHFKMNVFHWHLTDDGGWRLEIKKYPRLTKVGAWRRPTDAWNESKLDFPGPGTGPLYGGFYTQDELRAVVAYAAARHITVVPEIEMPGHCLPVLFAYPELKCEGGRRVTGRAYDATVMCPGREATFAFLEGVLDEVMQIFPSKVIHIGGDEVDRSFWAGCPYCQRRIRDEKLSGTPELQSYMIRRVEKYLNAHGRTLIGWDEILDGGLAPNAEVMSWRGVAGGIAAAKTGHQVVMSPTSDCYFDYSYDRISTEHVYVYEPVPADLTKEQSRLVLGAQGNVWTEWMTDFARVQTMVLPRMLALAEVLWSPGAGRSFAEFERRLGRYYPRFEAAGLAYYFGAPRPDASVVAFATRGRVVLPASSVPGVSLRYDVGGKEVTASSPAYRGPILVGADTVVKAAWFGARGQMGDAVTVHAVRAAAPPTVLADGLAYERFKGPFSGLTSFAGLAPDATGVQGAPAIEPLDPGTPFAVQWRGFVRVPREGRYTFTVGSDDGSMLWLYDTAVVSNDGPHDYVEQSGSAYLTAGAHALRIAYFNASGDRALKVWIEGPGLPRQPLAGGLLAHDPRR
jgi:hexosaminidase